MLEDRQEYIAGDVAAPDKQRLPFEPLAIVNPRLRPLSDSGARFFEGCLSVPGYQARAGRRGWGRPAAGLGRDSAVGLGGSLQLGRGPVDCCTILDHMAHAFCTPTHSHAGPGGAVQLSRVLGGHSRGAASPADGARLAGTHPAARGGPPAGGCSLFLGDRNGKFSSAERKLACCGTRWTTCARTCAHRSVRLCSGPYFCNECAAVRPSFAVASPPLSVLTNIQILPWLTRNT